MQEENDILKKLEPIKKNQQLGVPENYFEQFNDRLAEKIKNKHQGEKRTFYQLIKPQLAVAASFAALFLLAYTVFNVLIPEKDGISLTESEIYATLENELADIDELMLVEHIEYNKKTKFYSDIDLSEKEILEYLSNELLDDNLLIKDY
jgi:hypothetical protein